MGPAKALLKKSRNGARADIGAHNLIVTGLLESTCSGGSEPDPNKQRQTCLGLLTGLLPYEYAFRSAERWPSGLRQRFAKPS